MMLNGKWPIMVKWRIMDQHIHGWWCWRSVPFTKHIHGKWPINDSQMANYAGERGDWRYNRFSHQTEDRGSHHSKEERSFSAVFTGCWLSPTSLKNHGVKVSWDDDIPFHSIPNWMESHQKFHENPNGSSHHQSDQSVYAERHPNSQDNQKSLLLLSQWIIGSLCEAQMSSQVPLDAKNEAQIAGGWWRMSFEGLFTFTSPMVCTMIGWVPFYSILGVNSASSHFQPPSITNCKAKTLKAAGTVSESCSAWVSATTKR